MDLPLGLSWRHLAALFVGWIVSVLVMGIFSRKNHFDVNGKTVLLTGASEGMGLSVAKMLAAKGANIVISSRNVAKLEAAIKEITAAAAKPATQRFHFVSADLSQTAETQRVFDSVVAWNNDEAPDVVWCIAGASRPKLFVESSPADQRWHMDVNYFSCADMAHAAMTSWLAPASLKADKERHLVLTSSVVAFFTVAGYAPYAPSKIAIRALADTLAQEVLLYTDKIRVATVFPGTIASPGLARENEHKPAVTNLLEKDDPVQSPDEVARKSILGLEQGHALVTVAWLGDLMRACMWGGSPRNSWLVDAAMTALATCIWPFVQRDLNGKVRRHGREQGFRGEAKTASA